MSELWQDIFSYLDFKRVLSARAVNSDWSQLITGYREAGMVGVKNKPFHIIDTRSWIEKKKIIFGGGKLKTITRKIIPSFDFYHLIGEVNRLPQNFWPYLKGTNVHTLHLGNNQINGQVAVGLAKHPQETQVCTVNLNLNQIGDATQQLLIQQYPHIKWTF
jgi:hypothetical protein